MKKKWRKSMTLTINKYLYLRCIFVIDHTTCMV